MQITNYRSAGGPYATDSLWHIYLTIASSIQSECSVGARVGTEEAEPNSTTEQRVESGGDAARADLIKNRGGGARRLLATLHSFARERCARGWRQVCALLYWFAGPQTFGKRYFDSQIFAPSKRRLLIITIKPTIFALIEFVHGCCVCFGKSLQLDKFDPGEYGGCMRRAYFHHTHVLLLFSPSSNCGRLIANVSLAEPRRWRTCY